MTQFDPDAWASTDTNAEMQSNDPPEPGKYDVSVVDARAFQSKAGNDVLIVEWQVTSGAAAGYQWPDLYGFKNDGQFKATKSMCERLGIDVAQIASLDELDTAVKTKVGEFYAIEVVQNGQYRNVYIQGRPVSDVPDDGAFQPVPAGSPTAASDDDIPF